MKATTVALLEIQHLFPPEELARRRARWDRFWRGDAAVSPMIAPQCWEHFYPNILEPGLARQTFREYLRVLAKAGGDFLPAYACVLGTCALASAFGGTYHQESNGLFWIEPVVREPDDVYRLQAPAPLAGLVGKAVDIYRYVLEDMAGYIPPRVPDMQGPLNTAAMMWKQEDFILAMYDSPREVHHLLGLVTDHLIAVFRYFRDEFEDAQLIPWPYIPMPQHLGVGLTEDYAQLMSPELYREFGLPYVNRVAREFGGVYVHCCAAFKQHWPAFREIHSLRGLDTMYPYSHPAEITAAFPDVVHTFGLDYAESQRNWKDREPGAFDRFIMEQTPPGVRKVLFPVADSRGVAQCPD